MQWVASAAALNNRIANLLSVVLKLYLLSLPHLLLDKRKLTAEVLFARRLFITLMM